MIEFNQEADESPVTVWIVNYNSSDYLGRCLGTLSMEPIRRIIVLDNGSDHDEMVAARRLVGRHDRGLFISVDSNLGFGGGMNEISRSFPSTQPDEVVWILNPDCEVESGSTQTLVDGLRNHDIISPLITNGSSSDRRVWFAGGVLEPAKGACSHLGYGTKAEDLSQSGPILSNFLSGASILMRRSSWEKLGGFREDLFLYWEDADLCLRAAALDMTMCVLPQAVVWHREGGSSANEGSLRSRTYYYYISRNRIIVCAAGASKFDIVFGRGFIESLKLLARPLVREKADRLGKFASALRGTLSGLGTKI